MYWRHAAAHEGILARQDAALSPRFASRSSRRESACTPGEGRGAQAAQEVTTNAALRLKLAEKRYEAGVGNAWRSSSKMHVWPSPSPQAQQSASGLCVAMARVSLRKRRSSVLSEPLTRRPIGEGWQVVQLGSGS